jgi:hypothetical protein
MEYLIAWIIWKLRRKPLLVKPVVSHSSNTEWLVNFTNYGKYENRILQGESEEIVRERFMCVRPNAIINTIVCLNCG